MRTYTLTADPLQGIPVPFMRDFKSMARLDLRLRDEGFGEGASGFTSTPLYVVETPDLENGPAPRVLQSWLAIQGTGSEPSQRDRRERRFDLRRGRSATSSRPAAAAAIGPMPSEPSYHFSGGIGTVAGPVAGTSEFFGPNAEVFRPQHRSSRWIDDELHDNAGTGRRSGRLLDRFTSLS